MNLNRGFKNRYRRKQVYNEEYWKLVSFPDLSRRFFVSLAGTIDSFLKSYWKGLHLFSIHTETYDTFSVAPCFRSHFPTRWIGRIPGLSFGKNGCPSMGHSFLYRLSGLMATAIIRPCRSALQRYIIVSISVHLFRINLGFPHFFLRSPFRMNHCRNLVTDTHVRPIPHIP